MLSALARCRPSTMIWMPRAARAICRMTPTVPDAAEVGGHGGPRRSTACSDEEDHPIARQRAVHGVHRHRPVHGQRHHAQGKRDRFPSGSTGSDEGMSVVGRSAMGWLFDPMSEGTVKRAKRKYPFDDVSERAGLLHREAETRPTPLTCPRCKRRNDYQLKLGAADQEGPHSAGSRRARPRAVREAARLHDPGRRRRALRDVPDPVRGAVPSVARVPARRRARRQDDERGGNVRTGFRRPELRRLERSTGDDDMDSTSRRDFLKATAATLGAAASSRPARPRPARRHGPRLTRCSSRRRRLTGCASASSASAAWAPNPPRELPRAGGRRAQGGLRHRSRRTPSARARRWWTPASQAPTLYTKGDARFRADVRRRAARPGLQRRRRGNGTCP